MGRKSERVDAVPFGDLKMTCLLKVETDVEAKATLVLKTKQI